MKKKLYIIALLSVVAIVVNAQSFSTNKDQRVMPNQQVVGVGAYNGTVYEPFSTATPSEQSEVGSQYTPSKGSGPRKSLIGGPEDPPGPSPIGDAVLPMLLCAAVFCGVIALRRKRSALKG